MCMRVQFENCRRCAVVICEQRPSGESLLVGLPSQRDAVIRISDFIYFGGLGLKKVQFYLLHTDLESEAKL